MSVLTEGLSFTTFAVLAMAGLALIACACSASFTGSANPPNQKHTIQCGGGVTCEDPFTCPPISGGKCEAPYVVPETYGIKKPADAGQ